MRDIKFISYTGRYPSLCLGELTIEIDGETKTYSPFKMDGLSVSSGGRAWVVFTEDSSEEFCNEGPWTVTIEELTYEENTHLTKLFNDNVLWGCCGGCI